MKLLGIVVFVVVISGVWPYKFLMYDMKFGRSHVQFLNGIADILIDGGHELVAVSNVFDERLEHVGSTRVAKRYVVPHSQGAKKQPFGGYSSNAWNAKSIMDMVVKSQYFDANFFDGITQQCDLMLKNAELIESLRAEKIDVAYAENFDRCAFVLFHLAGIDKVAITDSHSTLGDGFRTTGAPNMHAYVPSRYAGFGEQMTFMERMENLLIDYYMNYMIFSFEWWMIDYFALNYPDVPHVEELLSNVSLVFLNRAPLVDFPQVTTHKIVDIGGFLIQRSNASLDKEWDSLLSLRVKTVLISFGSVALSVDMPVEFKESIIRLARLHPDITFIWKYEKPEEALTEGVENLVLKKWIPQKELLADPRLSAFITHSGAFSTLEILTAGKPVIAVPLTSDQHRNAQMLKRNGVGIVYDKHLLGDTALLSATLDNVLHGTRFSDQASKVARMLQDEPFSPREKLLRGMEFLARHGPLPQLHHYGTKLNFLKYYLIDVFIVLACAALATIAFLYFIIRLIVRCVCMISRAAKSKTE